MPEYLQQAMDSPKGQALQLVSSRWVSPDPVLARLDAKNSETNEAEFFALAGLWAGRDITQESLRNQAWQGLTLYKA